MAWGIEVVRLAPLILLAAVCDAQLLGMSLEALLSALMLIASLLVCHPTLRSAADLLMFSTLLRPPWRRLPWTIGMAGWGMAAGLTGFIQIMFLMFWGFGVPLVFVAPAALLHLLFSFLFGYVGAQAEARGRCDLVQRVQPSAANILWQTRIFARQLRKSTRQAWRRRLGRYWWLPRYAVSGRQK